MKRLFLYTALLSTTFLLQADPKADLQAAAKKLSDAPNYSWVSKTAIEGGQFTPAPIQGKAEKGGFALLTTERDGNVTTAVQHGANAIVKTEDGWKSSEELGQGGGGGGGGMRGRGLLRAKRPDAELSGLADKLKEVKAIEGALGGDLTEEAAKEWMSFGGGRQGGGPKNAKGSVKVWLKDGSIQKLEVKTSGTVSRNGEDRDIAATRTVEISEVGSTKVEIPEEAKKKLVK